MMYQKKAETLDKMIDIAFGIESRLIEQHFKKKPWNQVKNSHQNQHWKQSPRKDRDGDVEMNAAITTRE
jgi:protein-arginine kinase